MNPSRSARVVLMMGVPRSANQRASAVGSALYLNDIPSSIRQVRTTANSIGHLWLALNVALAEKNLQDAAFLHSDGRSHCQRFQASSWHGTAMTNVGRVFEQSDLI